MRNILVAESDAQQTAIDFAKECKGSYSPTLFPEVDEHGYKLLYQIYNSNGKLYGCVLGDTRKVPKAKEIKRGLIPFCSLDINALFIVNDSYYQKTTEVNYKRVGMQHEYTAENINYEVEPV